MSQSRHPTARRVQDEKKKKEAEDVFVEKILHLVNWSKENIQTVTLVGIALAVLVAGGLYYRSFRTSVADQAIAQLEQVQASVEFGDRETAKAQLQQYLERFDGTVYAHEARLILGQLHLEDENPVEAIEVLAPGVRVMEAEPIGIQAAFLMAAAYEQASQPEDAEQLFLRIARAAELEFQIREALAGAARIRTTAGDFSGAAELYEEALASMDLADPERTFWEMRLAEVTARAMLPSGGETGDPGTA